MENIVSNLIFIWMGTFKNLDDGEEDYIIADDICQIIGKETVAANASIPSAFIRKLPDICTNRQAYNTEALIFWLMYLGPILLKGRLKPKFYVHMCNFVEIMKSILWTITNEKVEQLKKAIFRWVQEYEE